jgi:hypothetical protein
MLNLFQYLFYHKDTKVQVLIIMLCFKTYNVSTVIELTFLSVAQILCSLLLSEHLKLNIDH